MAPIVQVIRAAFDSSRIDLIVHRQLPPGFVSPRDAPGHARPFVPMTARLVHERPDVIVTIATRLPVKEKLENEIDRYFTAAEKALKENIRLLYLKYPENLEITTNTFEFISAAFAEVYPAMYAGESIPCATGAIVEGIRPDVIIADLFLLKVLRTIKNVSGDAVPILGWTPASPNAILRFCGPSSLGGIGNTVSIADSRTKETGKSVDTVLRELYQPESGEVIRLPGLLAMYDYECDSHHLNEHAVNFQNHAYQLGYQFLEECDGIVTSGNTSFEPEICAFYKNWFSPRPAYFLGPLLPERISSGDGLSHSQERELNASSNGSEVKWFLDTIQKSHGEYSLLYISFGSMSWPSGDGIWRILEVVLDMKIPLILSLNPERITMPSSLQEQLEMSDLALVSTWVPQHLTLGHRATGWFLTHCGYNSVTEAVFYGVPMIAWPLGADQPFNAAYISSILNLGYELFETRVGSGLNPLSRGVQPEGTLRAIEMEARAVLTKAWGLDGAEKRKKIHALSKEVNKAWDEDGGAWTEFREFLEKFLPDN